MKILIEVNSNIGDLVMNIPVLNYFNDNFNDVIIDVIADKKSAELLNETSFIGKIFFKEKKFGTKLKLYFNLLKYNYDYAIGLRSDAVPCVIRAKRKLYKFNRDRKLLNKVSETLYHYSILDKYFNIDINKLNTKIEFKNSTLLFAKQLLDYKINQKILFISPGANSPHKIWPKRNFIELINSIKDNFDKTIIIGSPLEYSLCEEISNKTNCINLAGKTNLTQITALLSLGELFVGNDSGLGHISAAQKRKTLSIFADANPIRYSPYLQHSIFSEDLNIKNISVKDVLNLLIKENLLNKV